MPVLTRFASAFLTLPVDVPWSVEAPIAARLPMTVAASSSTNPIINGTTTTIADTTSASESTNTWGVRGAIGRAFRPLGAGATLWDEVSAR